MEFGAVDFEAIEVDTVSRDDMPALLLRLQHLLGDMGLRTPLFKLLEKRILPEVDWKIGRPG